MSKKIDLQSLRKASMDPVLKFKMGQRTKVKGIVTAQDKLLIRKFARMNLPIAMQRDPKITVPKLAKRLISILETLRPETRKVTLQQLRDYVKGK